MTSRQWEERLLNFTIVLICLGAIVAMLRGWL